MGAVTGGGATDPFRSSLGVYVLGALDAGERAEVEEHLDVCPHCRAELITLAGLPGLLSRLDPGEVAGSEPAPAVSPDGLAERALAELRDERAAAGTARSRRTVTVALLAAAAVAVLTVGITGVLRDWFEPGRVVSATDATTKIHAEVRMIDFAGGTKLSLELEGVPQGQRCTLVAVGLDGTRQPTSSWRATYAGEAYVDSSTWIPSWRLGSFDVVTPEGETLVEVPVT